MNIFELLGQALQGAIALIVAFILIIFILIMIFIICYIVKILWTKLRKPIKPSDFPYRKGK